jgi:hypothetical protein
LQRADRRLEEIAHDDLMEHVPEIEDDEERNSAPDRIIFFHVMLFVALDD